MVSLTDTEDHDLTFKTGVFWAHFTNVGLYEKICSNKCTAPGKIYDGSANTIMFSENINAGQINWANPSINSCAFVYPLEGGGSAPSDTNKASVSLLANTPTGVKKLAEPYPNERKAGPEGAPFPNSNHPGIVVMSMCDGSARTLSENVDKRVYTQLITPDGTRLRTLAGGTAFTPEAPLSADSF
jgi:hypothetical protein